MSVSADVVVIGAGQAGLVTSHELTRLGVDHIVLERGRIGQTWRGRWDSFCLVTPNWTIRFPGGAYAGDDPDGYMPRDGIWSYLHNYAEGFGAPVREGVTVTSLEEVGSRLVLRSSDGDVSARSVVVSTGAYQRPYRPAASSSLPADITQLDVEGYRNPEGLPEGKVLVIGSGQTGCQLAEELTEAGREVFLSCGRAPWVPRRVAGKDIVWWLIEAGFLDQSSEALPSPPARLFANILGTGHGGGHDLNLRTLRAMGVTLLGHFVGADDHRARFAPDLDETQAWGDDRYRELRRLIHGLAERRGLARPEMPEPPAFDGRAPEELDLSGFGAVMFTGGFRPDYTSWIRVPGAFDDLGFPIHRDGASTVASGLFFVGVHFLRKRKSSLLYGVGEDAAIVARQIAAPGAAN